MRVHESPYILNVLLALLYRWIASELGDAMNRGPVEYSRRHLGGKADPDVQDQRQRKKLSLEARGSVELGSLSAASWEAQKTRGWPRARRKAVEYSFCPVGGGTRVLTAPEGGIGDSVGFVKYSPDLDCTFIIQPTDLGPGERVELEFNFFDLEGDNHPSCRGCACDAVSVYDSEPRPSVYGVPGNEMGGPLCGTYNGLGDPAGDQLRFVSSGPSGLTVRFTSDSFVEQLGFRAEYRVIPDEEPTIRFALPQVLVATEDPSAFVTVACVGCAGLEFTTNITVASGAFAEAGDFVPLTPAEAVLAWDGIETEKTIEVQLPAMPSDSLRKRIARQLIASLSPPFATTGAVPVLSSCTAEFRIYNATSGDTAVSPPAQTDSNLWLLPVEAMVEWEVAEVAVQDEATSVTLVLLCTNCGRTPVIVYIVTSGDTAQIGQDYSPIPYKSSVLFNDTKASQRLNVTISLRRNLSRDESRQFKVAVSDTPCLPGSDCAEPEGEDTRDESANAPVSVRFGDPARVMVEPGFACGYGLRLYGSRTVYRIKGSNSTDRFLSPEQYREIANATQCSEAAEHLNVTSWSAEDVSAADRDRIEAYCTENTTTTVAPTTTTSPTTTGGPTTTAGPTTASPTTTASPSTAGPTTTASPTTAGPTTTTAASTAPEEDARTRACEVYPACEDAATYEEQSDQQTFCACPFDRYGDACESVREADCAFEFIPHAAGASGDETLQVQQGADLGSTACVSPNTASAGTIPDDTVLPASSLPERAVGALDRNFGQYDGGLDGDPPCVLLSGGGLTSTAATLTIDCTFIEDVREGLDPDRARQLRDDGWEWEERRASDALYNELLPGEEPRAYSGTAYNFSYAVYRERLSESDTRFFGASEAQFGELRSKTVDLNFMSDDTYLSTVALDSAVWSRRSRVTWELDATLAQEPGRFSSGGRIYTEFSVTEELAGVKSKPFRRHYIEVDSWRAPPPNDEGLASSIIFVLVLLALVLVAGAIICHLRRVAAREEQEEKERRHQRLLREADAKQERFEADEMQGMLMVMQREEEEKKSGRG